MSLDIRDFEKGDAESLYAIETVCFSAPWSLGQFDMISSCDYAHFFVATLEGCAVGFAGVYCLSDAELVNIAVLPEHRGKGIAKVLLLRAFECAATEGCDKMFLEVRRSNEAAISLYKSHGFSDIACRKNYYSHPVEDAIVMVKEGLL